MVIFVGDRSIVVSGRVGLIGAGLIGIGLIGIGLIVALSGDHAGEVGAFEAGVDIRDGDIRGTAGEHSEHGGDSPKCRAIAHACRDGDHGHGQVACHDAWKGTLHTGDDHDGSRPTESRQVR